MGKSSLYQLIGLLLLLSYSFCDPLKAQTTDRKNATDGAVTLIIHPDKTQFFRYDFISLSCTTTGNCRNWTVKRVNSPGSSVSCGVKFGRLNGSICEIRGVYTADSGQYWCESECGETSKVMNITVSESVVILESPALPVNEGDAVTLRCSYKERYAENSTSNFPATFHKVDGITVNKPDGQWTFHVSKEHEGLYKCKHPEKGESPQSLLTVREFKPTNPPPTFPPPCMTTHKLVCAIFLIILYHAFIIGCVIFYTRWARARDKAKRRESPLFHLHLQPIK